MSATLLLGEPGRHRDKISPTVGINDSPLLSVMLSTSRVSRIKTAVRTAVRFFNQHNSAIIIVTLAYCRWRTIFYKDRGLKAYLLE